MGGQGRTAPALTGRVSEVTGEPFVQVSVRGDAAYVLVLNGRLAGPHNSGSS